MWKNVTSYFSENDRHYINKYLEIDEVYDNTVEVSLFSCADEPYEIYVSYDCMAGIVYTQADEAYELLEEIKATLEKECKINKCVTDEFMGEFIKKYNLTMPNNLFFDAPDVSF